MNAIQANVPHTTLDIKINVQYGVLVDITVFENHSNISGNGPIKKCLRKKAPQAFLECLCI